MQDIYAFAKDANANLPTVRHVDGWGKYTNVPPSLTVFLDAHLFIRRIDEIKIADGWYKLNDVSAEEVMKDILYCSFGIFFSDNLHSPLVNFAL